MGDGDLVATLQCMRVGQAHHTRLDAVQPVLEAPRRQLADGDEERRIAAGGHRTGYVLCLNGEAVVVLNRADKIRAIQAGLSDGAADGDVRVGEHLVRLVGGYGRGIAGNGRCW